MSPGCGFCREKILRSRAYFPPERLDRHSHSERAAPCFAASRFDYRAVTPDGASAFDYDFDGSGEADTRFGFKQVAEGWTRVDIMLRGTDE